MRVTPAVVTAVLAGSVEGFWRMNCGLINTGRIDPIVTPGKVSSHVHKIAGAANIGLSTTYDDLQASNCTSCEIQADKSAYWTPQLYFQHANGTFEPVKNDGMTVYYLGRGDEANNVTAFPPGFRMLSGSPFARSYDTTTKTYKDGRAVADRVSFACLDDQPMPETPGMTRTQCKNGLRAQIHFQSCWNGQDLYKEDNSHVAYMSRIDNGECPPTHPVQMMHLFYEVLYSMDSVSPDGGKFVFAYGDTTGFGFHGDFLNGWDVETQAAAIKECATGNESGSVKSCAPLAHSTIDDFSSKCPIQKSVVKEQVTGLLDKLPGCIKITSGPEPATPADITCSNSTATTTAPSFVVTPRSVLRGSVKGKTSTHKHKTTSETDAASATARPASSFKDDGCWSEGRGGFALTGDQWTDPNGVTIGSCVEHCRLLGNSIAGIEFGQVCFCGNELSNNAQRAPNQCGLPCEGDKSQSCGGEGALEIFNSN